MTESTLYYEQLNDRCLWVDGVSSLTKSGLYNHVLSDKDIRGALITQIDSEIEKFSKLTGIMVKEKTSPDYKKLKDNFLIPEKYHSLDLERFFLRAFKQHRSFDIISEDKKTVAIIRIYEELELYKSKGLEDVLRTAIYIVDTFIDNKVVWGPGRGSSCCSYLLFLIGLHDVDSIAFELDIDEFLR